MRMPRCGIADQMKDEDFTRRRRKRYAIGGRMGVNVVGGTVGECGVWRVVAWLGVGYL